MIGAGVTTISESRVVVLCVPLVEARARFADDVHGEARMSRMAVH